MAQTHRPGPLKQLALALLNVVAGTSGKPAAMGNEEVRRILVVELWNIGDVVLLLPFLTQLRLMFPAASVTLLARPHARVILAGTGLVDAFIDDEDPADNWLSLNPLLGGWKDLWRLRRRLRSRRFDLAFQCRLHVREHVILAMSGARRRIGYAFGEGDRMLTDALDVGDPHRHKADDWLRLLRVLGGPIDGSVRSLVVAEEERATAEYWLRKNGVLPDDTLVGVHPGASLPEKRWPLGRFVETATALSSREGTRVIAFTDPQGYGEALSEIPGVIGPRTTLRELVALIARCDVLVCNDSGPMHIAGGLGTPTVAVFGSGVARWFAPVGDRHEQVTGNEPAATGEGIENVPVDRVLEAVDRILSLRFSGESQESAHRGTAGTA
jgi:ADP-heptose:LPS heptosyltransferase